MQMTKSIISGGSVQINLTEEAIHHFMNFQTTVKTIGGCVALLPITPQIHPSRNTRHPSLAVRLYNYYLHCKHRGNPLTIHETGIDTSRPTTRKGTQTVTKRVTKRVTKWVTKRVRQERAQRQQQ
ncbi:unnamed protein product, partial [Ectocarpus sp. 12 AP-2014]